MITKEQSERREYMVDLMKDVKGVHYTLGWLSSDFSSRRYNEDSVQDVVERTIKELESELKKETV